MSDFAGDLLLYVCAMADQRTFAERLQRVIDDDPSLTPAGLAVKAGLDNSAIRSILSGRIKHPRLDTAIRICEALGTTLEEFMGSAQTSEEREILRLLTRLSADRRRQLLGYGQALADEEDRSRREGGTNDE